MNDDKITKIEFVAPSFMGVQTLPVTCPHCEATFDGIPKKTFLGFREIACPECSATFKYPLYRSHRIFYWVMLAIATLVIARVQGGFPSIFILLMGFAVIYDGYLLLKRP
ncbi:MAG: hypothetical protein ACJ8GW_16355 [Massilia sp.]